MCHPQERCFKSVFKISADLSIFIKRFSPLLAPLAAAEVFTNIKITCWDTGKNTKKQQKYFIFCLHLAVMHSALYVLLCLCLEFLFFLESFCHLVKLPAISWASCRLNVYYITQENTKNSKLQPFTKLMLTNI